MRLIDVDAFLERTSKDPLFPLVERYGLSRVIENEPTVDAIPIEFIEKQAEYADSLMVAFGIPASLVANEYRFLVKEWRKENETDNLHECGRVRQDP